MAALLPVVITELAPPFRVLTFGGRNRPKPIRVSGQQRSVQTWYPGSGKASVQVMGTEEDPIWLEGRWDDPFGTINPAQGAGVRIAVARGLMAGQSLCQLLWGPTIVRQGRVKRVEILYQRANRTEFRILFEVDQANEAIALAPIVTLRVGLRACWT